MLNCINGVYQPQQGSISLPRPDLPAHELAPGRRDGRRAHLPEPRAVQGHERARQHHDRPQPEDEEQPLPAGDPLGRGRARGDRRSASVVERIIDFLEIQAYRKTPVGRLPYGLQKRVDLGRALAMEPQVLLLDEPMAGMNVEEKQDMSRFILDVNDEFGTTIVLIEHDMGVVMDISRPRRRARLRQEDRRRRARRGARQSRRDQRLPRHVATEAAQPWAFFLETLLGGLMAGHAVFADRARLRADLQGLGRLQFRAGRDGAVRRAGDGALRRMAPAADRASRTAARQRARLRRRGAA